MWRSTGSVNNMSVSFICKGNEEEKYRPHIHHSYKYNNKPIHHNLKEVIQQKTKKYPC